MASQPPKPLDQMTPEERELYLQQLRDQGAGYDALQGGSPNQQEPSWWDELNTKAHALDPLYYMIQNTAAPLAAKAALGPALLPAAGPLWLAQQAGIPELIQHKLEQGPLARAVYRLEGASPEEAASMSQGAAAANARLGERFGTSRLGGALTELLPGVAPGAPTKPATPPPDLTGDTLKRFFTRPTPAAGEMAPSPATTQESGPKQAITAHMVDGRVVFETTPITSEQQAAAAKSEYNKGLAEYAKTKIDGGPTSATGGGWPASFNAGTPGQGAYSPSRVIPGLDKSYEEIAATESPAVVDEWLRRRGIAQGVSEMDLANQMKQAQLDAARQALQTQQHPEILRQRVEAEVMSDPEIQGKITSFVQAAQKAAEAAHAPWTQQEIDSAIMLARDKFARPAIDERIRQWMIINNPAVAAQAYGGMFRGGLF